MNYGELKSTEHTVSYATLKANCAQTTLAAPAKRQTTAPARTSSRTVLLCAKFANSKM